jgi:hypothetical protein
MITLNWIKHQDGKWFKLTDVDLTYPHFIDLEGVYIIWYEGENHIVVRVGQGVIKEKLSDHQTDPRIMTYKPHSLYVTWATVLPQYRNGIERYLFEKLKPIVGFRYPNVPAIQVNLPWDQPS